MTVELERLREKLSGYNFDELISRLCMIERGSTKVYLDLISLKKYVTNIFNDILLSNDKKNLKELKDNGYIDIKGLPDDHIAQFRLAMNRLSFALSNSFNYETNLIYKIRGLLDRARMFGYALNYEELLGYERNQNVINIAKNILKENIQFADYSNEYLKEFTIDINRGDEYDNFIAYRMGYNIDRADFVTDITEITDKIRNYFEEKKFILLEEHKKLHDLFEFGFMIFNKKSSESQNKLNNMIKTIENVEELKEVKNFLSSII